MRRVEVGVSLSRDLVRKLATSNLGSEAIRCFLYLASRLDDCGNCNVSQTSIAFELDMKKSNVSKAIKLLLAHGFISDSHQVGKIKFYKIVQE